MLALAISSEEEDGRIYATYASNLREAYPASAAAFEGMAEEEEEHRRMIEVFRRHLGRTILPLRREYVRDLYTRHPVWLVRDLPLDRRACLPFKSCPSDPMIAADAGWLRYSARVRDHTHRPARHGGREPASWRPD
ncbi:MAG TPA: ferritin family protein [Nitrobacter sp.]|nr:ferritin family protein [Nitrobacter sp.]